MSQIAASQSITVVGRGSVSLAPDVAVLNVGLEVRSATPGAALSEVSSRVDVVLRALRDHGIEDEDLQTRGLSLHPEWDKQSSRVIGYTASYDLVLRVREIESASRIVDAVSEAAGDAFRLGGIDFAISSTDAARKDAAAMAVEDAKSQANVLAEAAGVRVGRVLSISEGAIVPPRPLSFGLMHAAAAAGPPIEAGTREFIVQVTVAFEIND